jgi:hypothetical protein
VNIESDLATSLDDLGYATTRGWSGLQEEMKARGAVIRVSQTGGLQDDLSADPRVVIEVYAARYAEMWAVAEQIDARLLRGHFRIGRVYVDDTNCESLFSERAVSESTRVLSSTWTLTARHHLRHDHDPVAP